MRWKVRSVAPPALCPRDVDVEDAERDGEALSPVDDARQVGVLHVVVGLAVALVAVAFEEYGVYGINLLFKRIGAAHGLGGLHGEPPKVVAIGVNGGTGTIERGSRRAGKRPPLYSCRGDGRLVIAIHDHPSRRLGGYPMRSSTGR